MMNVPQEPCIIRPNKPHVCIKPEHHHLHHPTESGKVSEDEITCLTC